MVIAKAPAATSAVSLPCDITAAVTAASKASSGDQSATSPKGALLVTALQPFEPGLTRVSRVAIGPVVRPEMKALPGARSTSNTGCRMSQGSGVGGPGWTPGSPTSPPSGGSTSQAAWPGCVRTRRVRGGTRARSPR